MGCNGQLRNVWRSVFSIGHGYVRFHAKVIEMPINLDIVPSTVRQAAELLASSLSANEREYFRITPAETLRCNFAGAIRAGWSLWEMNTPLQRDAIKHYSIAHAEDVSDMARISDTVRSFNRRFNPNWQFRCQSR